MNATDANLDAVALVHAVRRKDIFAVSHILRTVDPSVIAIRLAQILADAIVAGQIADPING